MSDHVKEEILLIGAGSMAEAYAAVLRSQKRSFTVVSRSVEGARRFQARTGIQPVTGGIADFCPGGAALPYKAAIVAVGVESLAAVTTLLLQRGTRRILVEKPAGLNPEEIRALGRLAEACDAETYVAYNRRFYASTRAAAVCAQEDGGVISFFFEFTELADKVAELSKPAAVKQNWLLANSSHVIDLAFHLGGWPERIYATSAGRLDWHAKSVFAGVGQSTRGATFAYQANWDAPGRWAVEMLTHHRRLILRPLEALQVQKRNSMNVEQVPISDELDKGFKPGVYEQVRAFLDQGQNPGELCRLVDHAEHLCVYEKIFHGTEMANQDLGNG